MRIKFHRIERKVEEPQIRANGQIKVPEVFLIDENGEAVGVISTEKAMEMAREAELDLVELNPKANPPVARLANIGQMKYEKEKKAHKQRVQQKKTETKNIRLSFRIGDHDMEMRVLQAEKFLSKDNKIKVELILRGRERQYSQKAAEIIKEFVAKLQANSELNIETEQPLTNQGGRFTIILLNKK
jgi:translation initiation factor IF-3